MPEPSPAPTPPALDRFIALLQASLADGRFSRLLLAGYHGSETPAPQRLLARRVVVKGQDALSFTIRYATRDITRNLPLAEAVAAVRSAIADEGYRNAHLYTDAGETQLAISRRGHATLRTARAGRPPAEVAQPPSEHNRAKHRHVEITRPWLVELGVTDVGHHLVPAMARKWKQINKFVEVFEHAYAASQLASRPHAAGAPPLRVLDFGSGKGYLTFALHDHLRARVGDRLHVTGVELREDLVTLCNGVAQRLALPGLDFETGDVRSRPPESVDVMIALHACDTATDYAIETGIRCGASIVMCSPCCHKQIRPQLTKPQPLRPLLQYGVHLGQEAEMLTDTLRALLLEACGYATQVFEFVSLEHTNKNKMILAVRRPQLSAGHRDTVLGQIDELKRFYGIRDHCLEQLLRERGLLAAAAATTA